METDSPSFQIDPGNVATSSVDREPMISKMKSSDPMSSSGSSGIDHLVPVKSEPETDPTCLEPAKAVPRRPLSLSNKKTTSRLTNEESAGSNYPYSEYDGIIDETENLSEVSATLYSNEQSSLHKQVMSPGAYSDLHSGTNVTLALSVDSVCAPQPKKTPPLMRPHTSPDSRSVSKTLSASSSSSVSNTVQSKTPRKDLPKESTSLTQQASGSHPITSYSEKAASLLPKRSVSDHDTRVPPFKPHPGKEPSSIDGKMMSGTRRRPVSDARSVIRVRPYPGKEPPSIIKPIIIIGDDLSTTASTMPQAATSILTVEASDLVGCKMTVLASSQEPAVSTLPAHLVAKPVSTQPAPTSHLVAKPVSTLPTQTSHLVAKPVSTLPAPTSHLVAKSVSTQPLKLAQASNLAASQISTAKSPQEPTRVSKISHSSTLESSQEAAHSSHSDSHSSVVLQSESSQPSASSLHSVPSLPHQASSSSQESVSVLGSQESAYSQLDSIEAAAILDDAQQPSQQDDSTGNGGIIIVYMHGIMHNW